MRSQYSSLLRAPAWIALVSLTALSAAGVTIGDLQKQLDQGQKVAIVDVRSTELYSQGHIPGAINIPSTLIEFRSIPPLGRVVLYGAGLGRDAMDAAAKAMARKPGITVDVLDGGYAAWQTAHAMTTQGRGFTEAETHYISYAELKTTDAKDVVLIDLRKQNQDKKKLSVSTIQTNAPLSDLGKEFPGLKISTGPAAKSPQKLGGASQSTTTPLYVLIDNNDGAAQAMARQLSASGNHRFTILAGGEEIIARQGQPGLQRKGGTVSTLPESLQKSAVPAQNK